MAAWSNVNATRRLEAIVRAVPGAAAGAQSASYAGFMGFAKDAEVLIEVVTRVLAGVNAAVPHPEWGDDGVREAQRETAMNMLDYGERWIAWRNASNWSMEGAISFAQHPPWER